MAVDWKGNKHKPRVPTALYDLTEEPDQSAMGKELTDRRSFFVWFAPPCGTFSRAREIPVPKWLLAQGAPEVRPLRDKEYPLGKPDLKPIEQLRVAKGNILARVTADMCTRM